MVFLGIPEGGVCSPVSVEIEKIFLSWTGELLETPCLMLLLKMHALNFLLIKKNYKNEVKSLSYDHHIVFYF